MLLYCDFFSYNKVLYLMFGNYSSIVMNTDQFEMVGMPQTVIPPGMQDHLAVAVDGYVGLLEQIVALYRI